MSALGIIILLVVLIVVGFGHFRRLNRKLDKVAENVDRVYLAVLQWTKEHGSGVYPDSICQVNSVFHFDLMNPFCGREQIVCDQNEKDLARGLTHGGIYYTFVDQLSAVDSNKRLICFQVTGIDHRGRPFCPRRGPVIVLPVATTMARQTA